MFVPNYDKIGIRKAADNQVFSIMAKQTSWSFDKYILPQWLKMKVSTFEVIF